jgi:CubicO group peptidase (beta-lactamase class C family)
MKRTGITGAFLLVVCLGCLVCQGCGAPSLSGSGGTGAPAARAAESRVFDVPLLTGIAIDGKGDDWGDRGFRVAALARNSGQPRALDNFDTQFRLGWDPRGLLVLVTTTDRTPQEADDISSLWARDSVELFYADRRGGQQKVQCVVAAGLDPRHPELRHYLYDNRTDAALKKAPPTATAARTRTKDGYVMEVLLPWSSLGIAPAIGRQTAFQIYVNDADGQGDTHRVVWYPAVGTHADSTAMYAVRLAAEPSPAVLAAASGGYDQLRSVRIDVAADGRLAGKGVLVRDAAGRTIAQGALQPRAARAAATLQAPMPPRGKPYGPLTVLLDGTPLADPIALEDADALRGRRIVDLCPAWRPGVFSPTAFPECQFEHPLAAEQLIGPYELSATYYDANFASVARPDRPGRYGAVAKIRAASGATYTRTATLYRQPKPLEWWNLKLQGAIVLPPELGIDPAVAGKHQEGINEQIKWALVQGMSRDDGMAKVLAGLREAKPGEEVSVFNDWQAKDRQWWVGLKRKLNGNDKRFAAAFACPRANEGPAAPLLRKGTCKEAGMKDGTDAKLDALLTEWAADSDQPFIACVARHGVIVLHKAYGQRDGKDMTDTTRSYMASLTKLIQGTCMMMLVDQGLVSLDAPVEAYLPEFKGVTTTRPLTVRHLFTHTAGMWGHWGDEVNDLEFRVAELAPMLEIGKRFDYNGMDLALASKIIEQVTGEALPTFYQKHLLGPLECRDTDVTNSSYNAHSTALDMARIGQMLANGGAYGDKRFFRPATRDKMMPVKLTGLLGPDTQVTWGIGCAWMDNDVLGKRTFGHGSAASATLRIDPDNDVVVSMTRNSAGKNFDKYHARFIRAVADGMLEATTRPTGAGAAGK